MLIIIANKVLQRFLISFEEFLQRLKLKVKRLFDRNLVRLV